MTNPPTATVYAVCRTDPEDHGVVAIFAARELAEGHAAQLAKYPSEYEVIEYEALDRPPARAKTHGCSAMVHRVTGEVMQRRSHSYGEWDYERPAERVEMHDDPSGWTTIHVFAHSAVNGEELLATAIAGKIRAEAAS